MPWDADPSPHGFRLRRVWDAGTGAGAVVFAGTLPHGGVAVDRLTVPVLPNNPPSFPLPPPKARRSP